MKIIELIQIIIKNNLRKEIKRRKLLIENIYSISNFKIFEKIKKK